MKTTKAPEPKKSKVKKSEKGGLFGSKNIPKLPPRKPPKPGATTQAGQANLAPKKLKWRRGEI